MQPRQPKPSPPDFARRAWNELREAGGEETDVELPENVLAICEEMAGTYPADACTKAWYRLLQHYGSWPNIPPVIKRIVRRGRELKGTYNPTF